MNESVLCAGAARRRITPPRGIFLIGYGDRAKGNVGVHDDLTATALVLDDGAQHLALVSLDLLAINEFIVDRIRARLARRRSCSAVPIPTPARLSTPTRSPPTATGSTSPRWRRTSSPPSGRRRRTCGRPVWNTPAAKRPSASTAGSANPNGRIEIGRNPEGPRDRSVQVVSVLAEGDGTRIATLVNYACHGTVLGPDNLLVSADWIGFMRQEVEARLGGLTLFLQGAAADINPDMYWEDAHAFERAAEQGRQVAQAALDALTAGSQLLRGTPLRLARTEVWLPTVVRAKTPRPPRSYRRPLLALAHLPGFMAIFADVLLAQRYPWKSRIEARDGFWSVPMRINAVRLGDLALVTYAAETFTEIGMKVKALSPARHTLFASVTDGCVSYLPTEEAHTEGGYEVEIAPLAYRYPGPFQPLCERIALEATRSLLQTLWR
jgi:neutral ceramidase